MNATWDASFWTLPHTSGVEATFGPPILRTPIEGVAPVWITPESLLSVIQNLYGTESRVIELLNVASIPVDKTITDALRGVHIPFNGMIDSSGGRLVMSTKKLAVALLLDIVTANDMYPGVRQLKLWAAGRLVGTPSPNITLTPNLLSVSQWAKPWRIKTMANSVISQ